MRTVSHLPRNKKHIWRIAVMVLLTACLHILVIDWGSRQLGAFASRQDHVVKVTLREVARPATPVKLPLAAPPSSQKDVQKASPATPQNAHGPGRLSMNDTATGNPPTVAEPADSPDAPVVATHDEQTPSQDDKGVYYHIDVPPSATISYDVEAIQGTLTYRALGTITWRTDGQDYTIRGEATSLFMTLLGFDSDGSINPYGVAPARYTERRIRKPPTTTYFDKDKGTIRFSSSDASYHLTGGEQDRASLVWQLASIGRGDAGQFSPGAVIDLFVAGVRDGEIWRVQVIGQESLPTAIGHVDTWHVVRQPKEGAYDQRIDIWFAPGHGWYPVKLRYTEPNNDYLDMSVTSVKLLQ